MPRSCASAPLAVEPADELSEVLGEIPGDAAPTRGTVEGVKRGATETRIETAGTGPGMFAGCLATPGCTGYADAVV